MAYAAPRWLPGGNLQTIWAALYARRFDGPAPVYRRERWPTPDGDFVDVDFVDAPASAAKAAPLLVLFHGLEGSSRSHYAEAFAAFAASRGMAFAVPHFRGCSGEMNLAPRAYHSGDFEEIGWILARMRDQHAQKGGGPVLAAGVSLGGNALMRWASEAGQTASGVVSAVASVCAPLDLAAGGEAIGRGFNKLVYTRMFLNTMKPKALAKLAQFPGLFDRERLLAARNLHDFDNVFTAPLHGFRDVDDYWSRGSAKPHLASIRVPALVANARNDPFIPASSLPRAGEVGPHVTLWQPEHGGHVGFPMGPPPGHVRGMPEQVGNWLQMQLHMQSHGGTLTDGAGLPAGRE
ncbi:YheT family hydrolase [Variovorax sp. OK605]|uniref:YheT family hydrolase n=1 Tax=Variovorax sp. OK605 TaxID=1855317 RepID=UPI000B84A290|nr:alpha/beta fold hydrolase [Variovorax sp. OK605]